MGGQLGAKQRRLLLASVSGRRTDDAGCCRGLAQLEGPGRGPRGRQLCCEGGCWPTPGLPGEARGNAVRAARLGRRAGPQSSPSSSTGAAAPRARPRCPAQPRTAGQRGRGRVGGGRPGGGRSRGGLARRGRAAPACACLSAPRAQTRSWQSSRLAGRQGQLPCQPVCRRACSLRCHLAARRLERAVALCCSSRATKHECRLHRVRSSNAWGGRASAVALAEADRAASVSSCAASNSAEAGARISRVELCLLGMHAEHAPTTLRFGALESS